MEGEDTASDSSAQDQLIQDWPVLDNLDDGPSHHARRWPLLAVALILAAAGGSYAVRIGPSRSRRALGASCSASPAARAPNPSVPSAITVGLDVSGQGAAQPADQVAGVQPPAAPFAAEMQVAAPAHAEATPANTTEQEPGSQSNRVSGETPSQTADEVQAHSPALGAATPGTEGLGESCRKADAGGKGKPMVVLAACRPAIEADPEAADIMTMLARAEFDLGRAAEARSWSRKALQLNPELADAYVFLGGAEQEMGKPAAAKAAYRKYLDLAPAGRHARELRAVLDGL